jgi:hypothetical protein
VPVRELLGFNVDRDSVASLLDAVLRRKNPFDLHASARSIRSKSSCCRKDIAEHFAGFELVRTRPDYFTNDSYTWTSRRDKHDIACL